MQRATLLPIIPLPGGSGHQRPTLGMKGAWKLERVGNSTVPASLSWVVAMSSRQAVCVGSGLPMSSLYMVPELYMVPLLSWTFPPNGLCPGSSVCWNRGLPPLPHSGLCSNVASSERSPLLPPYQSLSPYPASLVFTALITTWHLITHHFVLYCVFPPLGCQLQEDRGSDCCVHCHLSDA